MSSFLYFDGLMGEEPLSAALHDAEVQQTGTAKWKKHTKVFLLLQGMKYDFKYDFE